ncbi:MAG: hypothetical protein WC602_06105 [archaeon]
MVNPAEENEKDRKLTRELITATKESTKWQKWVAVGTCTLAIATFILAIITYLKP